MPATPFSHVYHERDREVRAIVGRAALPSARRVEELLASSGAAALGLAELAELLEIGARPDAAGQFEILHSFALEAWRKPASNRVRYVAPIYVSSFCVDACPYCNFSVSRTGIERKRLTLGELRSEIDDVMSVGPRVIELVYATDPEYDTERLVRSVGAVVEALNGAQGAGTLLCTEFLSAEAYGALRSAGLRGIVQWDETLDEGAYERWHHTSPRKRDFYTRMDNHDRALAAGLEVATGALFGLSDFRYDALMQIAKARHFMAEYGRGPFVFGVPRLKPIAGSELHLKTSVSDRAYETILAVYRLATPHSGRWLQTREAFDMNIRNLLDGDVFTYRCGDVTPGGYRQIASAQPALRRGQFGVNELTGDYVERELAARGFSMDYAWMR